MVVGRARRRASARCSAPSTRTRPCWRCRRARCAFSSRTTSSPSQRANSAVGSPPPPPPTTTTSASASNSPPTAGARPRGPPPHPPCPLLTSLPSRESTSESTRCRSAAGSSTIPVRARRRACRAAPARSRPRRPRVPAPSPRRDRCTRGRGRSRGRPARCRGPVATFAAASAQRSAAMPVSRQNRPLPARSWVRDAATVPAQPDVRQARARPGGRVVVELGIAGVGGLRLCRRIRPRAEA